MLISLSPSYAASESRILFAGGAQTPEATAKHLNFFEDPTRALTLEEILENPSYEFSPLTTPSPNFGFTENIIWLRLSLKNTTNDVDTWYWHVHENFLQHYDVYLQRPNGAIEHLDSHDPNTVFSDRKIDFPELATALNVSPGESATLFFAYWSGGSSNISVSLQTNESFGKLVLNKTSKNFISYGMMFILIFASFLALLILQLRVFLSYLLYVTVTLLFLMHSDGVAFQYFWPSAPAFNSYFSIIIGLAFAIVPYDFARVFLRTKEFHPRLNRLMIMIMIATPIVIIPSAFISPQLTKKALMLLVFLAILIGTLAGAIASIKRFREVRFYLFAWAIGALSAAIMNLRHFSNIEIGQNFELDSIRVSIVVDAIMMGLGVADRHLQNLKSGRESDRQNLQQARKNLELTDRLHDLEEQYQLATELVQSRDEQLKNTVHDLRQPLHALRLNVQRLKEPTSADDGIQSDLDATFTYLETLIADHLQSSVTSANIGNPENVEAPLSISLSTILASVFEMFETDANSKGLEFRFIDTNQSCDVEPLALMRILTNLVSNAIKYTSAGKILMGVRRSSDGISVEVHDSGPGLTQDQFALAKSRTVRLPDNAKSAEGEGLGLNIASRLAQENGLTLTLIPNRKTGTSIALNIPPGQQG